MDSIPTRSDGLDQFKSKRKLIDTLLMEITTQEVVQLIRKAKYRQIEKGVKGPFTLFDDGNHAFLFWLTETEQPKVKISSWKGFAGSVRDQMEHILCWAYSSSDLVSILRAIRRVDPKFEPLCPWYLCRKVKPESLGTDKVMLKEGHQCYGSNMATAFKHMIQFGVPKEQPENLDFLCTNDPPSLSRRKHYKIKAFRHLRCLKSVYKQLLVQAVGARLIVFSDMWERGVEIYEGPKNHEAEFVGYHGVVILAVEVYKGKLAAYCKMSNGKKVANRGFIWVSLEAMVQVVGVHPDCIDSVSTAKATRLLTNFIYPEIEEVEVKRKRSSKSASKQPLKKAKTGL